LISDILKIICIRRF